MATKVLLCVLIMPIVNLAEESVRLFDICGDGVRYNRLVERHDPLTVTVSPGDWSSLRSCVVVFRAEDTDETLYYKFTDFLIQESGTTLQFERRKSLDYTTQMTYNRYVWPSLRVDKKAYTYLRVTLTRQQTVTDSTSFSFTITNKGSGISSSLSGGSITGISVGIGFIITTCIVIGCVRKRSLQRRYARQNVGGANATVTTVTTTTQNMAPYPPPVNPSYGGSYPPQGIQQGYPPPNIPLGYPPVVSYPPNSQPPSAGYFHGNPPQYGTENTSEPPPSYESLHGDTGGSNYKGPIQPSAPPL